MKGYAKQMNAKTEWTGSLEKKSKKQTMILGQVVLESWPERRARPLMTRAVETAYAC